MALYYLDTSALVKLYVREPGTDRMLRLARPEAKHRFTVLSLTSIEFRSALRRRQRAGDIEEALATELIDRLSKHLEAKYQRQSLSEAILDLAGRLVDRHCLKSYDAIQLGGCLVLNATIGVEHPIFVCADLELLGIAEEEGLATLNPETPI